MCFSEILNSPYVCSHLPSFPPSKSGYCLAFHGICDGTAHRGHTPSSCLARHVGSGSWKLWNQRLMIYHWTSSISWIHHNICVFWDLYNYLFGMYWIIWLWYYRYYITSKAWMAMRLALDKGAAGIRASRAWTKAQAQRRRDASRVNWESSTKLIADFINPSVIFFLQPLLSVNNCVMTLVRHGTLSNHPALKCRTFPNLTSFKSLRSPLAMTSLLPWVVGQQHERSWLANTFSWGLWRYINTACENWIRHHHRHL